MRHYYLVLQEPHFPKIVLWTSSDEIMGSLKNTVTDDGICATVNANSMAGTFNLTKYSELNSFAEMLDDPMKKDYESLKVKGSGYLHRVEFWLNVRNPNPTVSAATSGNIGGKINAAINNWNDHFSVRYFL